MLFPPVHRPSPPVFVSRCSSRSQNLLRKMNPDKQTIQNADAPALPNPRQEFHYGSTLTSTSTELGKNTDSDGLSRFILPPSSDPARRRILRNFFQMLAIKAQNSRLSFNESSHDSRRIHSLSPLRQQTRTVSASDDEDKIRAEAWESIKAIISNVMASSEPDRDDDYGSLEVSDSVLESNLRLRGMFADVIKEYNRNIDVLECGAGSDGGLPVMPLDDADLLPDGTLLPGSFGEEHLY
ncbi:hypothetical protein RUND412_005558 [Rhizina undulata]